MTPDIRNPVHGTCEHCDEPIRATPVIEHLAMPPHPGARGGGSRTVDIWTHVASGHERCAGRDTFASPREQL